MKRERELISEGQRANMLLSGLKDIFAELQAEFVAETAAAAKKGADTQTPAMKISVLDDIVELIIQRIQSGHKAQEKLERRHEHASRETAERI